MPFLLFFDFETTGVDPLSDRIISATFMWEDGKQRSFKFNPGMDIPPGATAVHGINNADVKHCPPFTRHAKLIQAWLIDAILVGYNSKNFDARMLDAELKRAGEDGIDFDSQQQIDVYILWQEAEKRTLQNAAIRYLGRPMTDAHDSLADTQTTKSVYDAMRLFHNIDHTKAIQITKDADITKWVEQKDGIWMWKFGKHKGAAVKDTPDYVQWVLDKDFPPALKRLCQQIIMEA